MGLSRGNAPLAKHLDAQGDGQVNTSQGLFWQFILCDFTSAPEFLRIFSKEPNLLQ